MVMALSLEHDLFAEPLPHQGSVPLAFVSLAAPRSESVG